jgi:hypothetical protein
MSIARLNDRKSCQEARTPVQMVYRLIGKGDFRQDRELSWHLQGAVDSCRGNMAEADGCYSFEPIRTAEPANILVVVLPNRRTVELSNAISVKS